MIDRYLKDNVVTIHDDFRGTFSVPYQDSIGEIVNIVNDIELLNIALKEVEDYSFLTSDFINVLKDLICIFSSIFLSILLGLNDFDFLANAMPIIGIIMGTLYDYRYKKEKDKKIEGLNLQKNYIIDEINKKKSQKAILERNRAQKYLVKEEVIVLDKIAKRKALLQSTLDLLMDYKLHQRYFCKNFDNKTLGNILKTEEEKRLIQDVIVKERRR